MWKSISSFLQRKWWVGVGALAGVILLILAITQFTLPGGFGSRIVSPPPSDMKGNSPPTIQQSEKPSTDYREHPSPIEIKDQILGQPLLQQKNTGDSFIGLNVQWHLKLFGISTTNSDPNVITLDLVEGSSLYPAVICNIDIREHPEIKIAKQGIGVFVMGEISKAEPYRLELINCVIKLD